MSQWAVPISPQFYKYTIKKKVIWLSMYWFYQIERTSLWSVYRRYDLTPADENWALIKNLDPKGIVMPYKAEESWHLVFSMHVIFEVNTFLGTFDFQGMFIMIKVFSMTRETFWTKLYFTSCHIFIQDIFIFSHISLMEISCFLPFLQVHALRKLKSQLSSALYGITIPFGSRFLIRAQFWSAAVKSYFT